jgi:three-Cys-motif partner protein
VWELEPHTAAKHRILERYLHAWLPIISSWSNSLNYIDGFAGPGIYSKGEEGSPLIALRAAVEHKIPLASVNFIFVECREDRAKSLKNVLKERFPVLPKNFRYQVICGEFADEMNKILDEPETRGEKLQSTFVFIDPFGMKGFPMSLVRRILNCPQCEVLVTFMEGFIVRFTDELFAKTNDELFGTPDWRKVKEKTDPEERKDFLLGLYQAQMEKNTGCFVRGFEMKDKNGRTIYYLVFATKHVKGMEVMKEAMWKQDPTGTYSFSDRTNPNQKRLFEYSNEVWWTEAAGGDVYAHFKGKTVSVEDVANFVILETPWLVRKGILRRLEEKGLIIDVGPRPRGFTYPPKCMITFLPISGWTRQIVRDGTITTMVVSPFGDTDIKVRFPCHNCGALVESSENITLENPNFFADTISDSIEWSETGFAVCKKCKEEYDIEVQNGIGGMLIEIDKINTGDIEFVVTKTRES